MKRKSDMYGKYKGKHTDTHIHTCQHKNTETNEVVYKSIDIYIYT